ncbi:MAG: hypothetical protein GC200_01475 [Tepidisphaera sp.]|nr:hypothetical protein [Tepidisphaera sp.]
MNHRLAAAAIFAACASLANASDLLYSNGPIITNPTGGTGSIAGLPISNADGYMVPGSTFLFSTTGIGETIAANVAVAEDFTVPDTDGAWQLDSLTIYAFQSSQTTPTATTVKVNLWTAAPYSPDSPPPLPETIPQPVLAQALVLPAGPGTFVCHRESPTSTSTVRPVFAYTVSLHDLPNGGRLGPGTYWIQWSIDGASSPSQNVFTPLVSPRTSRTGHNARLLNSIDGSSTGPRVWFEGREGFVSGVTEGRAYELPFELHGSVVGAPCDPDVNQDGVADQGDVDYLINIIAGGDNPNNANPDFNNDGVADQGDVDALVNVVAGGPCP